MFDNEVYVVYVDGFFCGIAEDEYEAVELADNHVNGIREPLNDDNMADRLMWDIINVNRFYHDNHKYVNDKFDEINILCYSEEKCEETVRQLNKFNLEREREEARLRALLL